MNRQLVIAGNWKMNLSFADGHDLIRGIQPVDGIEVVVCPPFPYLAALSHLTQETGLKLGAQTCHEAEKGAYTGEVSAQMLTSVGCQYVIIGHSERRQYYGEDDTQLSQKLTAAFAAGLTPIFCVGESLEQREANQTNDVVKNQITAGLTAVLSSVNTQDFIVAYEPIWAIGTGKVATPEQAQAVHAMIRQTLSEICSTGRSDTIPILYGGSVKPANSADLLAQSDIDGALVGGASLVADDFNQIIKSGLKGD